MQVRDWLSPVALDCRGSDSGAVGWFLMALHSEVRPVNLQAVGRILAFLWIEHVVGDLGKLTFAAVMEGHRRRLKLCVQDYTVFMSCLLWSHVYGFKAEDVGDMWRGKLRALGQHVHRMITTEYGPMLHLPLPDQEGSMHLDETVMSLLRVPGRP